jgi:hypothetical protein
VPAPLSDLTRSAIQRDAAKEPALSERALAKRHGVSQATVHRILSSPPAAGAVVQLAPPPVARETLPLIEDLELQIRELHDLSAAAAEARAFGPSVAAKLGAAKLRAELEELRRAEPEDDEVTPEELADAMMALADDLVPVARAALERRELEGRR